MKTKIENIINLLTSVLNSTSPKNELMPRLIPVRVITNPIHRIKNS
jgi:hypothetical protein